MKHRRSRNWKTSFLIGFLLTFPQAIFASDAPTQPPSQRLLLATYEYEPYIGTSLPNNGYAFDVIQAALAEENYQIEIYYSPLVRAKNLAIQGQADGYFPAYYEEGQSPNLAYSSPFPGDQVGLLKRKGDSIPPRNDLALDAWLDKLSGKRFGMVRGSEVSKAIDAQPYLVKEYVSQDLQNIDKVYFNRIDYAVVDKYTAADLMVQRRPSLIGRLEFVDPPISSHAFHLAISRKRPDYQTIVNHFNEGLAKLEANGKLDQIRYQHGLLAPKETQDGKTVLTIGTVNNSDMLLMQELSKEYEKQNPTIQLDWRVLEEGVLRRRLLSDLAINDGQFDVMTIGAYEAPIFAERKWITPLSPLADEYDEEDLLYSVKQMLSFDDQLFALPFYAESSMLYYRKDVFQSHHLTLPKSPTFDDIRSFAKALHAPDKGMYGICLRGKAGWGHNMALVSTMVNAYGGRWFDMNWEPTLNTEYWRQALTTYKELLSYGPPDVIENSFNENLSLFAKGRCAMWIDATVAAGTLFNPANSLVADKVAIAKAPMARTEKGSHWLWTWALAIPESSDAKPEAKRFITWATSRQYIQQVAKNYGWVSVPAGTRKSTYQDPRYQQAAPFSQFVLDSIQTADPTDSTLQPTPYIGIQTVNIPEFVAIGNQVGRLVADMIAGKLSVNDTLLRSQRVAEELMLRSRYSEER